MGIVIDWDSGPEGATHYDTRVDVYPWLKADDNGNKFWHVNCWVKYANDIGVNDTIFARPVNEGEVTPPVFTQAMADAGELPSVGMECEFKHGGYDVKGTVAAITNEYIVLTEESGKERIRKLSESPIKPLTPPITLEDGKAYQFDCGSNCIEILGYYNKDRNSFFTTKRSSSKICGKAEATNIKLLEVTS